MQTLSVNRSLCLVVVLTCNWAAFPTAVRADFVDGVKLTVEVQHRTTPSDESIVTAPPVVVGPGVELSDFPRALDPAVPLSTSIDISARQILITLLENQPPAFQELIRFIDSLNQIPSFTNRVTINPATNWSGFTSFNLQAVANVIDVNPAQLQAKQGNSSCSTSSPSPPPPGSRR